MFIIHLYLLPALRLHLFLEFFEAAVHYVAHRVVIKSRFKLKEHPPLCNTDPIALLNQYLSVLPFFFKSGLFYRPVLQLKLGDGLILEALCILLLLIGFTWPSALPW